MLFVRLHDYETDFPPMCVRADLSDCRAALSVPANIVEGRAGSPQGRCSFASASASLDETRYYVHVASRLGNLTEDL